MKIVAGVDEVGRGCLAGPVVAAAVVFPPKSSWEWVKLESYLPEITDSKKLSKKKRQNLANIISETCDCSTHEVSAELIDDINIFQASLKAMRAAVENLHRKPDLLLVDGPSIIPHLDMPQRAIVDGDKLEKVIGAASIVAKVYRDSLMSALAPSYPEYGFEKHVGYGTEFHRKAIALYGPCPLHRRSFRGVKEYVRE